MLKTPIELHFCDCGFYPLQPKTVNWEHYVIHKDDDQQWCFQQEVKSVRVFKGMWCQYPKGLWNIFEIPFFHKMYLPFSFWSIWGNHVWKIVSFLLNIPHPKTVYYHQSSHKLRCPIFNCCPLLSTTTTPHRTLNIHTASSAHHFL